MANDQALERFVINHADNLAKVEDLRQRLNAYIDGYDPDDINWGHVGDMAHVNEKLAEILEFLNEYKVDVH